MKKRIVKPKPFAGLAVGILLGITAILSVFSRYLSEKGKLEMGSGIIALVGLVGLGFFAYYLVKYVKLAINGVKCRGKVIELSEGHTAGWGRPYFHPIVKFEDRNGESIEVRSKTGSTIKVKVGSSMAVCYDPKNPQEAIMGSLWVNGVGMLLLGLAGLGMLALGYYWGKSLL
jgi:hypothetical protein